jgi:transcriptional regulator with PAS, ATPase and Fis domain
MKLKKRLAPEVIDRLMSYHYPGNVRELLNIMERMIILSDDQEITVHDLPMEFTDSVLGRMDAVHESSTLRETLEAVESKLIARALKQHRSISEAARHLGVHPSTLCRKIARYKLLPPVANLQEVHCNPAN